MSEAVVGMIEAEGFRPAPSIKVEMPDGRPWQSPVEGRLDQRIQQALRSGLKDRFIRKVKDPTKAIPAEQVDQTLSQTRTEIENEAKIEHRVAELRENLTVLIKCRELIKALGSKAKEHPEYLGMLVSTMMGIMGAIHSTPIPDEYNSLISAAIGGGAIGFSKGEGMKTKLRNAAIGGAVAVGAVGTAGHFVDQNSASVGVNFSDEGAMIAATAVTVAKKAIGK